jgi:hypothetical protein
VEKVDGYHDLDRMTGRLWPVLFWLPTPARERHLHDALSNARTGYPVATAVHGHASRTAITGAPVRPDPDRPAGPVWWLHQHARGVLPLAELGPAITDLTRDTA